MNGRHNHRTRGKAPCNAAYTSIRCAIKSTLQCSASEQSVSKCVDTEHAYLSPISGGHRHILLGIDNDQIDDDGEDVDIIMKQMTKMIMMMVTSK